MKKIITALAAVSLVFAFALATTAHAQLTSTSTTNSTLSGTTTSGGGTTGTSDSGTVLGDTASPGLPNTGAGGDAATTVAILLATGLLAIGGTVVAARRLAI
jgi:hypothetical protein